MALQKIIDIPEPDLDKVRRDLQSDGAETRVVPQSDGRYTITARFPDPLIVRLRHPRNLLIAGLTLFLCVACLLAWHFYSIARLHNKLGDFGLPPDLYDRQNQLRSMNLQGEALLDLDWLDSTSLTDLAVASRNLHSLKGLARVPQLRSLEVDLNNVAVESLNDISSVHGLQTLTLHSLGRANGQAFLDCRSFPEMRSLDLDLERSLAPSLPTLTSCQQLQDLTLNLKSATAISKIPDLSRLSQLRSVALFLDGSQIRSLKPLAKLDGLQVLKLSLDENQIGLLSELNDSSGPQFLDISLTSLPNDEFPDVSRIHNLIGLSLQMPGVSAHPGKSPIPNIAYLRKLQALSISLPDSEIRKLPELGRLTGLLKLDLDLESSAVEQIPDISQLRYLQELTLNVSSTGIRELPSFAPFLQLRELNLSLANSQTSILNGIDSLRGLRTLRLDIRGAKIGNISSIAELSSLENLVLRMRWSQIGALPDLAKLQNLRALELQVDGFWGTEELPNLSRLPHLNKVKLVLERSQINDLSSLNQLAELEELELDLQGASLEVLPDLAMLKKLSDVSLDIRHSKIQLGQTGNLHALRELVIDNSFSSLEGLPESVKRLTIGP